MDGLRKFAMNILLSVKRHRRLGEGNREGQLLEAELFSCKKITTTVSKGTHKSIFYNRYKKKYYNYICYHKISTKVQIQEPDGIPIAEKKMFSNNSDTYPVNIMAN